MTVKLQIALPPELFRLLESAAARSCSPVSVFAREILEADVATRRLAVDASDPEETRLQAGRLRSIEPAVIPTSFRTLPM